MIIENHKRIKNHTYSKYFSAHIIHIMSIEDNSDIKKQREKSRKARYRQLSKLESILHVKFKERRILNTALTHRSYINETGSDAKDNERLEHLGDSVLGFIISEYLFKRFLDYQEGNLAKMKSVIVSDESLAGVSSELNIGGFILMGKGEEQSGGRSRISILANTMESIIGAIYLDQGLKQSRKFILKHFKNRIDSVNRMSHLTDPKTRLQEYVQKKYKESPVYEVTDELGPAHQKEFIVRLIINGREVSSGRGASKRKAEMKAARDALKYIEKDFYSS
jgi:ribonuclease III